MLPYGISKTVVGSPAKHKGRSHWTRRSKTMFRYLERKRKKSARQHAKRAIVHDLDLYLLGEQ